MIRNAPVVIAALFFLAAPTDDHHIVVSRLRFYLQSSKDRRIGVRSKPYVTVRLNDRRVSFSFVYRQYADDITIDWMGLSGRALAIW